MSRSEKTALIIALYSLSWFIKVESGIGDGELVSILLFFVSSVWFILEKN